MGVIKFFVKYFIFWLINFAILRSIGLMYFSNELGQIQWGDKLNSFLYGLRLDASVAAYFLVIPLLIYFISIFCESLFYKKWIYIYTIILVCATGIIYCSELGIITSWSTKINYRAVTYLFFPKEAAASMGNLPIWLYFTFFLIYFLVTIEVWRWFIFTRDYWSGSFYFSGMKKRLASFLLFAPLLIIPIRGGFQKIPINESVANYSNNQTLNFLTINSVWYLVHNVLLNRNTNDKNPYAQFDLIKADNLKNELFKYRKNRPLKVLKHNRPNIVFIQLESLTASLFESLGEDQGVMPFLDSLAGRGLLFTRIYSPGLRTDQGLTSLQSAFPAQPTTSIIKHTEKISHLPSLAKTLSKQGYHTSFYYGGEINFGNFKSYAVISGFNQIYDQSHFHGVKSSPWGMDDEHVLLQQGVDLDTVPTPFYSYLITLTSHEPFKIPIAPMYSGDGTAELFCNAAHYTDTALKNYFDTIKTKKWYNNTLFVMAADHGHSLPKGLNITDPKRYHIPLIIFGEPLKYKYRGKKIKKIGSQVDIASTILKQLEIDDSEFQWSNDLLNPKRKDFAYFSFEDGMGWIVKKGYIVKENKSQKVLDQSNPPIAEKQVDQAKAYLQILFDQFIHY